MLRVTVELVPHGIEKDKKLLGAVLISNDGTGNAYRGNYKIKLTKFGSLSEVWREGVVQGFPRRSKGPFDLLLRALVATVGERNKRQAQEATF